MKRVGDIFVEFLLQGEFENERGTEMAAVLEGFSSSF